MNNQFQRGDFDRLAAANGQFPHEVELTLTRDEPMALFPRRLVYFHKTATKNAATTSSNASTPILDYKLFDIRQRPDLTAEAFELDRDQNLDDYEKLDETTEFLRNLGL